MVQARQFFRRSGPGRAALRLHGQGEDGLRERHTVQQGRSGLPGTRISQPFGLGFLLFPLDRVPVALDLIGHRRPSRPQTRARMQPDQLVHYPVRNVVDRVPGTVTAFGRDAPAEHHLQQHAPEFLAEGPLITGLQGLEQVEDRRR